MRLIELRCWCGKHSSGRLRAGHYSNHGQREKEARKHASGMKRTKARAEETKHE
jgi:hypothetical protein